MANLSPSVFLVWSILTTSMGFFYVYHLWHFDRFQCLNVFRKAHGPFRRFMTYSLLVSLMLFFTYSTGFAVISYREGYMVLPSGSVIPKPYILWTSGHQAAHFPLNMLFALAWGSEAATHLEELCFWLFVIHSGVSPTPWFRSIYFRIWAAGSLLAMVLVPVVAAITRDDDHSDSLLQCVGSTMDFAITVAFLPILWVFPSFVQKVKNEGADTEAIVRLAKYHDLNIIRIGFRFLFVVPLLMLSIDNLQPGTHIFSDSTALTDLLAISSSVGCVVQAAITLMIFFPRNVELETQRWLREPPMKSPRRILFSKSKSSQGSASFQADHDRPEYLLTDSPVHSNLRLDSATTVGPYMANQQLTYGGDSMTTLAPRGQWSSASAVGLTEMNRRADPGLTPTLHPMAHNFTSPINITDFDPLDFPPRL